MGHDDFKLHFFWSFISSVQQGMEYKSAISFNNNADFYDEKVIRKTQWLTKRNETFKNNTLHLLSSLFHKNKWIYSTSGGR